MKTTAVSEDGSHYVLNGAKTFITGGVNADRVIVCARTSAPSETDRRFGITLLVVDTRPRATPSDASSTSWACAPRTPPSCRSPT